MRARGLSSQAVRAERSGAGGGIGNPALQRRGFTLLEVLLALVLLAALLASLNQFIFSITEVWTRRQEQFVFVQHARAVTRHVSGLLETAAASARRSATTEGSAAVAECLLPDGVRENLLQFDLPEGDRLLAWPGPPLPEVVCALGWREGEGLVLYWKSRLELDFGTAPLRQTVLSPYVAGLSYDVVDPLTGEWRRETELRPDAEGALPGPGQVRLRFRRGPQELEEVIRLPDAAVQGVPSS